MDAKQRHDRGRVPGSSGPAVTQVDAAAYRIPTDAPEADGTLAWDATTMVLATVRAGGAEGIGWSYAATAARQVITDVLAGTVTGRSAPNLHAHAGVAVPNLRHVEYFHDHQRIERMLFDGALDPDGGILARTRTGPGSA
jgi:hypothetical protein